jgi:hypothetical protein
MWNKFTCLSFLYSHVMRNLERRPRQLIVTSLEEDLLATAQNFLPVTQASIHATSPLSRNPSSFIKTPLGLLKHIIADIKNTFFHMQTASLPVKCRFFIQKFSFFHYTYLTLHSVEFFSFKGTVQPVLELCRSNFD